MATTTVAIKPLPTHIQAVCNDAVKMGWDVDRNPNSVKITPPKGAKVKPFSLSLTKPPVPPQLQEQLNRNGFNAAAQAWRRDEEPQPKDAPQAAKATDDSPVCPECKARGAENPYTSARLQSMAAHRRRAHGVVGESESARQRREKLAASKKAASAKKAAPTAAAVPAPRVEAAPKAPLQINTDLLPNPVAEAVGTLLTVLKETNGDTEALRKENEQLRDFRSKVVELANDGTKAPVQVVATILDLVKETEKQ